MLIDALLEAMSAPVPDAHGVIRDVEVAMTGRNSQHWNPDRAAIDDAVKRWESDNPPCGDCKVMLSTRGVRCNDCKGMRSEKFVLQGESDSPAEEN